MSDKYLVVTAIIHERVSFCIPMSDLDEEDKYQQARDLVNAGVVKEFSSVHISSDIMSTKAYDLQELSTLAKHEGSTVTIGSLSDWYIDEAVYLVEPYTDVDF